MSRGLTGTCRGEAVPCPCSLPEGLHRPVSSWSGLWARLAGSMASTQGCPPRLWASGARGEPHWPLSGPVDGPEVVMASRGWGPAPGERDLVPPHPGGWSQLCCAHSQLSGGAGSPLEADTGFRRTGKRTLPGTASLGVCVALGTGAEPCIPLSSLPVAGSGHAPASASLSPGVSAHPGASEAGSDLKKCYRHLPLLVTRQLEGTGGTRSR